MAQYEPQNIPKKSATLIKALQQETLLSAEATIQELNYLLTALKQYKTAINESINLNLEKSDLILKYKKAEPGGIYNLPAVLGASSASYDLTAIKQDNERLKNIKEDSERAEDESELYYRMITQNTNDLIRKIKKVSSINSSLKVYFQQLENYNEWESKS